MLSDGTRLRILSLLMENRMCVSELSAVTGQPISTISRHLSKLSLTGMIMDEQSAQWVYYVINPEFLANNQLLLDYIAQNRENSKVMIEDKARYKRYNCSEYCCKDINSNKR